MSTPAIAPDQPRCPACGHEWDDHDKRDGCWHGWGTVEAPADGCPCDLANVNRCVDRLAFDADGVVIRP